MVKFKFKPLSWQRRVVGRIVCFLRGYHLWHGGSMTDMKCIQCDTPWKP
jgi:hypothetical protein